MGPNKFMIPKMFDKKIGLVFRKLFGQKDLGEKDLRPTNFGWKIFGRKNLGNKNFVKRILF